LLPFYSFCQFALPPGHFTGCRCLFVFYYFSIDRSSLCGLIIVIARLALYQSHLSINKEETESQNDPSHLRCCLLLPALRPPVIVLTVCGVIKVESIHLLCERRFDRPKVLCLSRIDVLPILFPAALITLLTQWLLSRHWLHWDRTPRRCRGDVKVTGTEKAQGSLWIPTLID